MMAGKRFKPDSENLPPQPLVINENTIKNQSLKENPTPEDYKNQMLNASG